jgi:hydroxymethylpyrimidine/phosphomethylpyrimidine kinase
MPTAPPVVLTIAGFDPSSGAGVTADIKTIAAHECFGIACITALTVQSTQGVKRVEPVDPKVIAETLAELASDFEIAAVHVGMLGNEGAARAVAEFLGKNAFPNVVLDPILKSSSGADLLDAGGVRVMVERLFPLAELIVPNLEEALALTESVPRLASQEAGREPTPHRAKGGLDGDPEPGPPSSSEKTASVAEAIELMREAARHLHARGAVNVVVTGGDLRPRTPKPGVAGAPEKAVDLLSFTTGRGVEQEVFKAERQRSNSTHGTGCAFSSALACHLAHGRGLPEAVLLSKAYVSAAISNSYPMGHGKGPLHHLYRMHQQRRPTKIVSEAETAHARN